MGWGVLVDDDSELDAVLGEFLHILAHELEEALGEDELVGLQANEVRFPSEGLDDPGDFLLAFGHRIRRFLVGLDELEELLVIEELVELGELRGEFVVVEVAEGVEPFHDVGSASDGSYMWE